MAHFLSTENSNYINKNIEIYTKNKVGQYSKYLNSNPIFVTYYSLSDANIRADSGLGGVEEEIGPQSPLRWNKILEFPLYNIPDLKPQLQDEDNGTDIELDLNDIALLPNTLKPKPEDYFIIDIPNVKPLLFRVNSFGYNSIQSNDYYTLEADLWHIGANAYDMIQPQVIDEYSCIFENIGTDDKCFIKNTDLDKVYALERCIMEIRDWYTSIYYNKYLNLFWQRSGYINNHFEDVWNYDIYLTRFINESKIFQDDFNINSIVLTYDDNIPSNFEFMWRKTLFYAILKRDTSFLMTNLYNVGNNITKRYSVLNLHGYDCKSVNLIDFNGKLPIGLNYKLTLPIEHYFSNQLITTLVTEDSKPDSLNYIETIIFNYLKNLNNNIDIKQIEKEFMKNDIENFKLIPILIYILFQIHSDYFKQEDTKFLDRNINNYNQKFELR